MDKLLRLKLKAQAHHLKPVVMIGTKGLTPAVIDETHLALQAHELIKVKINGMEKEDRHAAAQALTEAVQADLVQIIGNTAILWRKNPD